MTLGPLLIDIAGERLGPEDREVLQHPLVGGVILFSRNYRDPQQLAALVADIQAVRQPPLLVTVDHEGGRVQRFRDGFSALPAMRRIGFIYDIDAREGLQLARQLGWLMAVELRAVGIDLSFAPCVDLDYGVSSVIGDRALHADADLVARLAVAYMLGMRAAGMAATAKHFPGHGAVVADSHVALPVDRRELASLEADLRPYRALIANGLAAVMVGHILFPAVDAQPASLSPVWIRRVLRGELQFSGVVFADDLSMQGAAIGGDIVERCARAIEAGCDVLPICNRRDAVLRVLDEWRWRADPALALRLVRLRARGPRPTFAALRASAEWQACQTALQRCNAPPPLKLD
ncbi:MAG: beta-N-acetylhexosaminidase [Steroidobacteraceae bacterium]|nr:beta-N-acetylhexosaminidase [Steroidobacteraceae bacterium]MDW8258755.1 beta-N-acetylhexosaminidase [Gammaproteobacteria bacterium]